MKLTRTLFAICVVLAVSAIAVTAQINPEITGKRWKLTEVNGVEVTRGHAFLQLEANTNKYSGSSGCNFIGGEYKIEGTHIRFTLGFITRRACLDNEMQKLETEFTKVFYEVTDFKVEEEVLRLYKGDQLVLVFKA